jgi:hypothetical protein
MEDRYTPRTTRRFSGPLFRGKKQRPLGRGLHK